MKNIKRFALSLIAGAIMALALPVAASAQGPAPADPLPSYATGNAGGETIRGTVLAVIDKYNISVRDDRGFIDNETLHDGTIINPRGLTLAPGQRVQIAGTNVGRTFAANEIDTPYVLWPRLRPSVRPLSVLCSYVD